MALVGFLVFGAGASDRVAAAPAPACSTSKLNVSAARAGGAVTVSPTPDSVVASYRAQVSFLGVPAANLTVASVVGSRSGPHPGVLEAYSQGDGASFVPAAPFAEGEVVTVHAVLHQGTAAQPFSWHFTTAKVDRVSRSLETPPPPPPPPKPKELQRFVSRPDLEPPAVAVTERSGSQAPGDLFLAPYAGPGQYGPMILDREGGLLWFKRLPAGTRAANLRVQEYAGRPVLTWWQDPLVAGGHRSSGVVIADGSYHQIAAIRAGNGYQPDLHAFEITPQGSALFTVYDAIRCNLSAYGGPADGAVADTLFQEVDLKTGLVRFEWHALDHVSLAESYMPAKPGSPHSPWDFFHINAIAKYGSHLLVDSRNTWTAYELDAASGQVVWRLGGKKSSFAMGRGATPAWQHDARQSADGTTITLFDNGGTPVVHSQSRAIVLRLDQAHMTATLVSSFTHSKPLLAASQGNFQQLPEGNWSVGWGQEPFFSEFGPAGQLLFDAHLPAAYQSFTVLDFPWSGAPTEAPRLALRRSRHGLVGYVSWNGATAVASWRLLGGGDAKALSPVAATPRSGFETRMAIGSVPRYLAAQALDANGQVLATSAVARS